MHLKLHSEHGGSAAPIGKKWWLLIFPGLLWTQALHGQVPAFPALGTIDFYGLRTISESEVRDLLPLQEGFDFTGELPDPETITAPMTQALGVARIELSLVCCNDLGLSQLYIGVQETERSKELYLPRPASDVRLASDVVENFEIFLERMTEAVLSGDAREDRTQGHALADSDAVRRTQETFLVHAEQYTELLDDVLRHSSDARHRSIAAHVLGYARNKSDVAPILASAVLDPDEGVRNYATRSLAVIAEFANANPDHGVMIPPDSFIDMLNSTVWSDRNKSLGVLVNLTEDRDPELLATLRANSMAFLKEMCEWHHWGHAEPACLILQRIIGLPDDKDEGARDRTLSQAMTLMR